MITESRDSTDTIADFDETENRQADRIIDGLLTRDNENVSDEKDSVASGGRERLIRSRRRRRKKIRR